MSRGAAGAGLVLLLAISFMALDPAPARGGAGARPELSLGRSALYDYDPPEPGSYQLPVIKEAGDGDVLTADGKPVRLLEALRGHITILSFIYTRCADPRACPMATGALYEIQGITAEDAALANNLRLITFSFDPEHDTPQVMADYAKISRPRGKGCEWLFLTTQSESQLKPILASYGQRVDRKKNANDAYGPFFHVVRVYLVDSRGRIRNVYAFGMLDPRLVLTDVRTLVMEETAGASR